MILYKYFLSIVVIFLVYQTISEQSNYREIY